MSLKNIEKINQEASEKVNLAQPILDKIILNPRLANFHDPVLSKLGDSRWSGHFVSDTLYDRHITNLLDKNKTYKNYHLLKQKDVNMTYFEIDAQIHGIKELKKNMIKEWNRLSLEEIFRMYTALHDIAETLYNKYGEKVLTLWLKNLIMRMNRENILGKNMETGIEDIIEMCQYSDKV